MPPPPYLNRDLVPQRRRAPAPVPRDVLSPVEQRAVEEYLIDLDPVAAAARAGLTVNARQFFARPKVQRAVTLARSRRLTRMEIYGDDIVRRWDALARADPREIAEVRRVNCRNCHGEAHEHQYNDVEYRHAIRNYNRETEHLRAVDPDAVVPEFDPRGGPGFRQYAAPHPDCPVCDGQGELRVVIKDSSTYSPSALLLMDGVTVSSTGQVQVKLRDRSWAEQQLARFAGVFNDRRPIEELDPSRLTRDQLESVVVALAERGVVDLRSNTTDAEFETIDPPPNDDPTEATESEPEP